MADNLTHSYTHTISGSKGSLDIAYHQYYLSNINSSADSKIPQYSKINSVNFSANCTKDPTGSLSIGDLELYFGNTNDNTQVVSLAEKDKLSFKGTENISANITSYAKSEHIDAGYIECSGAELIMVELYFSALYNQAFNSTATVTWNYNEPRAIVSVSKSGEGTVSGAGTYHYGNSYTIKATPATGWKFVKWSDGNTNASRTFTVDSSLITAYETSKSYQAVFEKLTYTVTWKNHDGTVLETDTGVAYGSTPTYNGSTPTKTGYTFSGWSPAVGAISGNTTYTAQFTENKYTIAFNGNGNTGGSMSSITNVGYDDSKTLTANAYTKTGYTFAGWATSASGSVVYSDKASVSKLSATNGATVTLYAKWTANSYTIKFNANGGSGSMSDLAMTYDTAKNLTAKSFTRTGYDFLGWSTSSTATTATYADKASVKNLTSTNKGTVTLYAVWKIQSFAITVVASPAEGGTVSGGGTFDYNKTATLTATANAGWKFKQWNDGNTSNPRTVTVTGATTYTATFEKLTYLVRWFNEDGSKLLETDSSVPYGTMPTYNGATPTKTATAQYTYTHIGWAVSPTAENTTGLTAVVANIDYYARFRADINKYTVTWKNDDGTVLETDTLVPYGTPPDYNGATPTKASTAQYDYTFLGWSAKVNDPPLDEGNLPTVSGNITYTAVYLPVVRKYDLNIVAYDCTVEGAVNGTYDYGTEFTITVDPDFGYKFVRITDVEYDTEYTDNTLMFILTGDTTLHCVCERLPAPIFASPEQQVKDIYIVPALNTIVYVIDGVLPTLKTTMHTVDDLHFSVINIDIDSSKYANYQYYPIEQWYVNDKYGNSTRVW